ncbi:MAG: CoA transferase [Xanthobacteraceae bacterium]|jgi:alpha-methylacyl-CoA racemase
MQPLADVLVLDFTTLLPGPLATLMLADAGAQVIKIERPGGEDMRRYEPRFDGESAMFAMLNRGKKSLVLDLKDKSDRARLMPLVKRADVLVEQFRPGVMARLGLGSKALRKVNPRLIYCSITGYGQTGPRAAEAGHDINYIGNTGLLALQPGPLDRPNVPPALIADIGGGTLPAVMNILLALRQRDRAGKGATIDVAMSDAMFTFASHAIAVGHITGTFPGAGNARLTGGSPRYQLYPTRDGKLVACGALEQKFWTTFTAAIGLAAEFIDDRRDPAATTSAVAAIVAGRKAEELKPVLAKADCCVTIVATLEEALRDPHFIGRGLFEHQVSGASGATMPALPVPIAPAFRARHKTRPLPVLGAHNKLATTPRRASAAAAKRKARPPRARRRGATGRAGR